MASYIAAQLYSAYAERYCALHSLKANIISLKPEVSITLLQSKNITLYKVQNITKKFLHLYCSPFYMARMIGSNRDVKVIKKLPLQESNGNAGGNIQVSYVQNKEIEFK